jgi:hypothetical protein
VVQPSGDIVALGGVTALASAAADPETLGISTANTQVEQRGGQKTRADEQRSKRSLSEATTRLGVTVDNVECGRRRREAPDDSSGPVVAACRGQKRIPTVGTDELLWTRGVS